MAARGVRSSIITGAAAVYVHEGENQVAAEILECAYVPQGNVWGQYILND